VREYFAAGARRVWVADPVTRSVRVYASPGKPEVRGARDILEGGEILPGFSVPVLRLLEP
jgi:hypothetical protein